ncbi:unnamed protein product, partial [Porites evermanni]
GVVNGCSSSYKAINSAIAKTSNLRNVTIVVRRFTISKDTNLVDQAAILLQQNVVALIEGSETKNSACALSTVTGIPLIYLHGDKNCKKTVQMLVGHKAYARASLDIISRFNWEKVTLLFEENRLQEAAYFYSISQSSSLSVRYVEISDGQDAYDGTKVISSITEQIKGIDPQVLLLYTNKDKMENTLQQIESLFEKHDHIWILQGEVPLNLSCLPNSVIVSTRLPCKFDNVTASNSENNYTFINKETGYAYDSALVLSQAVSHEPCSSMNGINIGQNERNKMASCLKKVHLEGVTGNVQFDKDGKRNGFEMEVLNLRNDSFEKIGTWSQLTRPGVVLFDKILQNKQSLSTPRGIEGRKFKVVVAEAAPYVMRTVSDDGTESFKGYCMDLLDELARILKFSYEIYTSPDGLYGAETENGSWNGMIGELIRKNADMIISDLTVTESREEVVDFSIPFMFYTEEMLVKKQHSEGSISLLQFMHPFHGDVWTATLFSLVVISIALFLINYYSPCEHLGTNDKLSLCDSVWFTLACMLRQASQNTPRNLSGRILTGSYWFCVLILVSSYTANLAAFFTVKSAETPIKSLEDVAKSAYKVGVIQSSSVSETLRKSEYEMHKAIWQRIEEYNTEVHSVSEGVELTRNLEQFVFIQDGPVLRYAANQPPCDLTIGINKN